LHSDEKASLVFIGSGVTSQEMDVEFKKLYDSLVAYKDHIFRLVDKICEDCEAAEVLAMNIAERDSVLLQQLVAKECEKRNMTRNLRKKSLLTELEKESSEPSVDEILRTRSDLLKDQKSN